MELARIEKLVEKYDNAETTIKEEEILRDYFLSNNVAPHLEGYQMMFTYFKTSKDETTYNKTLEFKPKKRRNYKWLSVAASVALLFSTYIGYNHLEQVRAEKEALEKYAQVEDALRMLSTNLNKGKQAFNSLYAYENSVNKIFKTK